MIFEKLNTFFLDKDLSESFVSHGVISLDVVNKYEMYQHYCYLKNTKGLKTYCNPIQAKRETAAKYRVSLLTVRRCIQFMES